MVMIITMLSDGRRRMRVSPDAGKCGAELRRLTSATRQDAGCHRDLDYQTILYSCIPTQSPSTTVLPPHRDGPQSICRIKCRTCQMLTYKVASTDCSHNLASIRTDDVSWLYPTEKVVEKLALVAPGQWTKLEQTIWLPTVKSKLSPESCQMDF